MAISFFQKIRMGLRGWSRRRTEEAAKRDADFVARQTSWGKASPAAAPAPAPSPVVQRRQFDLEGLQVAYLDDSGQIEHYLDLDSGDVIEFRSSEVESRAKMEAAPSRYRRVPTRTERTESADRSEFVQVIEDETMRRVLHEAMQGADPLGAFRQALARDRALERSWYNFKNRRAAEAIDRWLREQTGEGR